VPALAEARSRATLPERSLEPAAAGDEELQIKLVLAGRIDGEENHVYVTVQREEDWHNGMSAVLQLAIKPLAIQMPGSSPPVVDFWGRVKMRN
jgi:hypothetical protein